jgi:gluconolactonase
MSLYPPPKQMKTELFTSVPDEFRFPNMESDWVKANKPGQKVHSFLEGPSFDRDGNLFVTDIPYGRIFKISPAGKWSLVAQYNGWPNGLRFHKNGRVFIADYKLGIVELDPVNGKVTPFLTHNNSEGFKGVNDLVFDEDGRLYFTDQGQTGMHNPTGRVFRYDFDAGKLDCLLDTGPSPNGLVLNPEENVLYVGMTRGNAVWRIPILPDGSTSKVGIFTQLAGGVSGADGLAMDVEGNLTVCDAGNGCVWMFSKWGEPLYRIVSCGGGRTTTNLAYGGPENKTLFFTESDTGNILKCDLPHAGKTMFAHS